MLRIIALLFLSISTIDDDDDDDDIFHHHASRRFSRKLVASVDFLRSASILLVSDRSVPASALRFDRLPTSHFEPP